MSQLIHRSIVGAWVGVCVAAVLLCSVGPAHAEPSADDKALATMLFREGRTLMSEGRIPEACQKLEESQRLDPGGGTLLNLALCHEQEGRFARSFGEFNEAVVVARRDGRRDREIEAANHARALEPRLSRLTIMVPAATQVEGLRIERDGREVGKGAWSTAMPIDGGEHVVRATALGREPFTTTVVIGKESDAQTVEIPVLATPVFVVTPPRVPAASVAATPVAVAAPTEAPMTAATAARLRWGGVGTAGAGVVLLGTAGWALAAALGAKDDSNADCMGDVCGAVGLQKRSDAVSRGTLATVLGISGVVLVGAGATLYYFGRRAGASAARRDARTGARFMLGAAPGTVVTGIEGGF